MAVLLLRCSHRQHLHDCLEQSKSESIWETNMKWWFSSLDGKIPISVTQTRSARPRSSPMSLLSLPTSLDLTPPAVSPHFNRPCFRPGSSWRKSPRPCKSVNWCKFWYKPAGSAHISVPPRSSVPWSGDLPERTFFWGHWYICRPLCIRNARRNLAAGTNAEKPQPCCCLNIFPEQTSLSLSGLVLKPPQSPVTGSCWQMMAMYFPFPCRISFPGLPTQPDARSAQFPPDAAGGVSLLKILYLLPEYFIVAETSSCSIFIIHVLVSMIFQKTQARHGETVIICLCFRYLSFGALPRSRMFSAIFICSFEFKILFRKFSDCH